MDAIADDVVIKYRGAEEGDLNFILNSWMKSYQGVKRNIRPDMYFLGQQRLIGALAQTSDLIISCDGKPGQSHFIYGYICGKMDAARNELLLHYVYVKQGYRTVGVAKDLLVQLGWNHATSIQATHWTPTCVSLAQRFRAYFNDYPLTIGNQDV